AFRGADDAKRAGNRAFADKRDTDGGDSIHGALDVKGREGGKNNCFLGHHSYLGLAWSRDSPGCPSSLRCCWNPMTSPRSSFRLGARRLFPVATAAPAHQIRRVVGLGGIGE